MIDLLRDFASAAIDLSDGLLGDLGHILTKSRCGALLEQQKIPAYQALSIQNCLDYALSGGDDYQILFTVAVDKLEAMVSAAAEQGLELFDIGEITQAGFFMQADNATIDLSNSRGFDHFAA